MRLPIAIGVVVLLAGLAVPLFAAPAARGVNVAVNLYASLSGWSNTTGTETNPGPTIVTNTTDSVTVTLTSDGGRHIFLLDYNHDNNSNPAEPISGQFGPPSPTTTTLTFGSAPAGQYWYFCTVHTWAVMRGRWIVLAQGSDTTPPWISALAANPANANPGGFVNITATVADNQSAVADVHAHVVGPLSFNVNSSMNAVSPTNYFFNQTYAKNGTYAVTVWGRDTSSNYASRRTTFTIGSATATRPWIVDVKATPSLADPGGHVNVTARVTDNASAVTEVYVNVTGPGSFSTNVSMSAVNATDFYFNRTYAENGTYTITIWAKNGYNNYASRTITFTVAPANPSNPGSSNLLWALLAVLLILLLLAIFLWMRKRPKAESPPESGGAPKE